MLLLQLTFLLQLVMTLNWLDWAIIGAFFALSIGISFRYKKLGESGLSGFFLGGRNMPWYLAGLSMVATTFAADTPLAVTELVAQGGIAKNWLWWNALSGGLLTTIFFTRLWRRSGVLTEVEFIDLRYSGPAAKFLRGFKSIYLGLFINAMIIAWVNQAFMALVQVFFDVDESWLIVITGCAMLFVFAYSSISGLKGIAVTDAIQFIIAILGCIILAVLVLGAEKVGGIEGLKQKLPASAFEFFPVISDESTTSNGLQIGKQLTLTLTTFLTYIGVLWWSSWYPGAEPGGGGYVAQRIMASKDEKNSVFATLFFQIAHYCLRPWPWIIVALAALVLYPELTPETQKLGYVMAMKDFLPAGLKGMLLVAFLGAYMSTISTQLNWGASYLVNDFYVPFIQDKKTLNQVDEKTQNRTYTLVSRLATFAIMLVGLWVTTKITTITGVWEFIFQCGSGLGLVLILRWFWHRINVWSEITATIAPFFVYGYIQLLRFQFEASHTVQEIASMKSGLWYYDFANGVLLSVGLTTIIWIVVTYLTKPTDSQKLTNFYNQVKPNGVWGKYGKPDNSSMYWLLIAWLSGVIMVYSVLFCSGKVIFHEWNEAGFFGILGLVCFVIFRYTAAKGKLFQ